jgi:hypothetical protein
MKQRGELAYESDAESEQNDADEGMRSDTEANTEQKANGTGDTKAKVVKGRKRKREAGAMEGASLKWRMAPDAVAGQPALGAPPPLSGGGG